MNFKFRFALLFSLSVFIILAASAIYISIINEEFREEEFYTRLNDEVGKASNIYFQTSPTPAEANQKLKFNTLNTLHEERLTIFDSSFKVVYTNHSNFKHSIPQKLFEEAREKKIYNYSEEKWEAVISYSSNPVPHYIIVSAFDKFGRSKANNLLMTLIASVLGGLILSSFLSFFYVRQIIKPLNNLKVQMQRINEQNLTERLVVSNQDDELNKIATNFNDMLDRLEKAFETRKRFVQHASHELRTPMANMLSQTEAALNQDLSKEQYRTILLSLKEDQQDMISLTNSLLLLSQYETLSDLEDWKLIRVDELIYEVIDITKNVYRNAVISVDFKELPENEESLLFRGNELLIKSAFQNLIRNACNYSDDNLVNVTIHTKKESISICFDNKGRQLSHEEQQRLFIPFFRGDNSTNKKGFGLGLSIVQRILSLHKASVKYEAIVPNINRFTVSFPRPANKI